MKRSNADIEFGARLQEVHRHAWRADAPPLDLDLASLVVILPNLIESGSVGLVWPRLRHRAEEYGAAGVLPARALRARPGGWAIRSSRGRRGG